jgi:hypothetical protein
LDEENIKNNVDIGFEKCFVLADILILILMSWTVLPPALGM